MKRNETPAAAVQDETLFLKSEFSGFGDGERKGDGDHWTDVMWIYNNLLIDGLIPSDAPSTGAWFWLMECRRDPEARKKFRDYYMKMAPSRKELDEKARRQDEGLGVLALIEAVEGALGVS